MISRTSRAVDTTKDFQRFVAGQQSQLLRYGWLLTGDWAGAEDLVQEALARVWPKWARVRDGDPTGYTKRTITNLYLSARRRRWNGEEPRGEVPERPSPVRDVEDTVADRLIVRDALALLSRRQRAILILRVVEDLPEAQVADIVGCAIGTVKSTMAKSIVKLRNDTHLLALTEGDPIP